MGADDGDVDRPTLLDYDNIRLLPAFLAAPPLHDTLELGGKHDETWYNELKHEKLEQDLDADQGEAGGHNDGGVYLSVEGSPHHLQEPRGIALIF